MSSGVPGANIMGPELPGRKISSSRLAMEQIGGIEFWSLFAVYMPSLIPDIALESCHLPPSMMMR